MPRIRRNWPAPLCHARNATKPKLIKKLTKCRARKTSRSVLRWNGVCMQHGTMPITHVLSQSKHSLLRNIRCRCHTLRATGGLRCAVHVTRQGPNLIKKLTKGSARKTSRFAPTWFEVAKLLKPCQMAMQQHWHAWSATEPHSKPSEKSCSALLAMLFLHIPVYHSLCAAVRMTTTQHRSPTTTSMGCLRQSGIEEHIACRPAAAA